MLLRVRSSLRALTPEKLKPPLLVLLGEPPELRRPSLALRSKIVSIRRGRRRKSIPPSLLLAILTILARLVKRPLRSYLRAVITRLVGRRVSRLLIIPKFLVMNPFLPPWPPPRLSE